MPMPYVARGAAPMGQQQMSPAGQLGGLQQAGAFGGQQSMGQASPAVQQQLAQMRLQGGMPQLGSSPTPQSMYQPAGFRDAPAWGQQASMWGQGPQSMGQMPQQSMGPQAGQPQRPNPMMPAMLRGGPMRSTR